VLDLGRDIRLACDQLIYSANFQEISKTLRPDVGISTIIQVIAKLDIAIPK
jgi:hypothetical protein